MLSFHPDQGLMYLIQQVTKQSTDEILGFFYDFGKEVFILGVKAMKPNQREIRKNIEAIYPGTSIPFHLNVEGGKRWGYNATSQDTPYRGTIHVKFPENTTYIDTSKLMEMIMEKQLLGGSSLPDFEPPPSHTPKMYKALIQQVLKGPSKDETVRDS